MEKINKNKQTKVICMFDKDQEDLDIKIIKIFESYLEKEIFINN